MPLPVLRSNFSHLQEHDPQLLRLGMLAERYFAEERLMDTRAQVERLTPATLAKAFRGELVPQDPQDEPASKLLERLAREGRSEQHRKRRTGRL